MATTANKKSTSTKQSTAKKSSTTKKSSSTSTAKKSTTRTASKPTTPLRERDPQTLARQTGLVAAALANDAYEMIVTLPERVQTLASEGPTKLAEMRKDAPDRIRATRGNLKAKSHNQRLHLEAQVRDLRGKANKRVDGQLKSFEKEFDKRVKAGDKVIANLRKNERFQQLETQAQKIWDQSKNTRTQLKGALTSIRKTADAAVEAASTQAGTARTQVKAAATSARKTADTVVAAGKELAS